MRGQENVSGIAAIKHSLRDVNPRSCEVRSIVNIGDRIDRAAVNTHPQLDTRMISQCFANLERTSRRLLQIVKKKQRHPISCRHTVQLPPFFRSPKTFRVSHDPSYFFQKFTLVVDE